MTDSRSSLRWHHVGHVDDLPAGRVKTVSVEHDDSVLQICLTHTDAGFSALDNHCPHQGGPLGEGKIVDGCITCPWHGFQYRMEDGQSPPPFTEKIATYATRIVDGVVYVNPEPNAPGTPQAPSEIGATS